jgi:hypothetical protein
MKSCRAAIEFTYGCHRVTEAPRKRQTCPLHADYAAANVDRFDRAALRRAVESAPAPICLRVSVSLWPISVVGPHYRRAASAGKANTTIVGEPGFLSFQKFDGLPDATAMYCRPPVE